MGERITKFTGEGYGAPELKINQEVDYSAYQWKTIDGYPGKVFFSGISAETLDFVIDFRQENLLAEELEQLKQGKTVQIDCQDVLAFYDRFLTGGLEH